MCLVRCVVALRCVRCVAGYARCAPTPKTTNSVWSVCPSVRPIRLSVVGVVFCGAAHSGPGCVVWWCQMCAMCSANRPGGRLHAHSVAGAYCSHPQTVSPMPVPLCCWCFVLVLLCCAVLWLWLAQRRGSRCWARMGILTMRVRRTADRHQLFRCPTVNTSLAPVPQHHARTGTHCLTGAS